MGGERRGRGSRRGGEWEGREEGEEVGGEVSGRGEKRERKWEWKWEGRGEEGRGEEVGGKGKEEDDEAKRRCGKPCAHTSQQVTKSVKPTHAYVRHSKQMIMASYIPK